MRAGTWGELTAVMQEVEAAARRGAFDSADAELVQRVIRVDSTGRSALAQAFVELSYRVEQIQADCVARRTGRQSTGQVREIKLLAMDFTILDPPGSSAHVSLVE